MNTGLTFEQALTRLKAGHKIARLHWQWRAVELLADCQDIRICQHNTSSPKASISLSYSPTSDDMLAIDWKVVQ